MKKRILMILLLSQVAIISKTFSQNIAINETGSLPDTSAMLDVNSTTKGFLTPRMTTTQQNNIPLPATGLLIFNTSTGTFNVNTGTSASPVWTPLQFGGSGGITSLGGLTGATQTFSTGTTGTDFGISSSGTIHTFNIPDASATARGVITTAAQTIAGNKTLSGNTSVGGTLGVTGATTLSSTLGVTGNSTFTGTVTASTLTSGASTDSIITATAAGLLRKRRVVDVLSGSAITSLGGLTGSTQTFSTGTTGTDFNIASSGTTHTFNIPDASATARGAITTGVQTIAGNKTLSGNTSVGGTLGVTGATTLSSTLGVTGNSTFTGTITASTLASGAATDSLVTATATGLLRKRRVVDVLSGSAITSLGGLTGSTQTFATGTTGTDFNISSSGTIHTFNIPDASATTRGAVTTGAQTIAGNKTLSGNTSVGGTLGVTGATTLSSTLGVTGNSTFTGTVTASTLASGASTDSIVTVNASTGLLKKRTVADIVSGAAWTLTGNGNTASATNFLGTTNNASLRIRTNNAERMVVDSNGYVGVGVTNPLVNLEVADNINIRRVGSLSQLIFTNTAGTGDFRIGGDGNDIYWQGGGGRCLQMGSYWATILIGDRQSGAFPAFEDGITGTSVIVKSPRDESVPLGIQGNSVTQSSNLTEWRNSSGTAVTVVNPSGYFGIGTASPSSSLHVYNGLTYLDGANQSTPLKINIGRDGYAYGNRSDDKGILFETQSSSNTGNIAKINVGDEATVANNGNRYLSFSVGSTLVEAMYINNQSGTTRVGIGTSSPTAFLHIKSGTATAGTAPIKINDGTLLSTIEEGTIEKDGNVFYATPDATNRGVLPAVSFVVNSSDVTMNNNTTAQSVFGSGKDVINVAAATTYEFEAYYVITTGTTNHTTAALFGGTATLNSIGYFATATSAAANTTTTTQNTTNVNVATAKVLNTASTAVETVIRLKGIIRVNAAGTLIPQIQFSAAPGGTNLGKTNSYFKLTPIGTNTVQTVGSWN